MRLAQLNDSLNEYGNVFQDFVSGHQIPVEWFKDPDHFAIKCANLFDYLDTCDTLIEEVEGGVWELAVDQRRLASAQLAGSVALGGNKFEWVEVMQPKPGKELKVGFVEHTEFYFPDFYTVESVLKQRGLEFQRQMNQGHSWVNVTIDDMGREIKFNDKPLAAVVVWERENGLLHQIKVEDD